MTQTTGKLTAIYGPMFSGKTTFLIKEYGEGEGAVVFKPDLDERYTKRPVVISHDKEEIPAVLVNHRKPTEMLDLLGQFDRVFIDEVNFFDPELIPFVKELLSMGKQVYVAGLVYDSEKNIFGPMKELIDLADETHEMYARCDGNNGTCSKHATLSYRKVPKDVQIRVAGADEYGACCEDHYQALHHAPSQKS